MSGKHKPSTKTASNAGLVETEKLSLKDYFELSRDLTRSDHNGLPRWFSPLDRGCRFQNSPLLLYLPGFDGNGLGHILHHQH